MRVAFMAGELIYANVRLRLPANRTYELCYARSRLGATGAIRLGRTWRGSELSKLGLGGCPSFSCIVGFNFSQALLFIYDKEDCIYPCFLH